MALIVITLMDNGDEVQVGTVFDPVIMQDEPTPAALAAARMLATVTNAKADEPLIQLLN